MAEPSSTSQKVPDGKAKGGSDSEEDEVEDDEEEEPVEPKLKYERLGHDVKELLKNDAASCLGVHSKFLALGTHWGVVHILDLQGNRVKQFPSHTTTVNEISIDAGGDYVASCSDDGVVVINGLYSTDNNLKASYDYPVKSLALDPEFGHRMSCQYVTGGENLILHSKGMFRQKTVILHGGEGPVRSIKWRKQFIAWANDVGVKMYDCQSKQRITYINREADSPRPELYRCNLCWRDDRSLLIGWGNFIKVCAIKERINKDVRDLPSLYVEITHMLKVDYFVAGIAPFGTQLVVLSYLTNVESEKDYLRPYLRILQAGQGHGVEEVSLDELNMRGWEQYRCNDYRLEHLSEEGLFYLVSPRDVVLAKPRDLDDHIAWLLEYDKFEEALATAEKQEKDLNRHSVLDVGVQYVNHLIDEDQFEEAAELCPRVLKTAKKLWEEIIMKFIEVRRLEVISPFIPRVNVRLDMLIYELVLNTFLQHNQTLFCSTLKEWSPDLYNVQSVIRAVQAQLEKNENNRLLLEAQGQLYTFEKRYDKALYIYLKLQHDGVFELIHQHNLFNSIQDKLVLLMNFNPDQASKMLIDNIDKVPVQVVVDQLHGRRDLLYKYLHNLFLRDSRVGQDFHEMQVELYAEFDEENLLPFLKQSNSYPLQKAMSICESRGLIREQVFLLGRMGDHKHALALIINKLKDVNMAIEFAKEQNDEELWEDLITSSVKKPAFITGLLRNIGTHMDPIRVIKRIPNDLRIPELRDSLVKIMHDFNLQISLREGCDKILVKDCVSLLDRLSRLQRRGIGISDSQRCQICNGRAIGGDGRSSGSLCVFYCHHVYHQECLQAFSRDETFFCQCCTARKSHPRDHSALHRP